MERIIVVGPSGSGKSTLAARLATVLDVPHVELDALWWERGWTEAGHDRFVDRATTAIGSERWVVDGNYFSHGSAEVIWPRADTIVWLDLPRWRTIVSILVRTAGRWIRRVELWNGNRETLRDIVAKDSLLPFAWRNHHAYAERYEPLQARGPMDGVTWLRFRSRADARRWLDHLVTSGAGDRVGPDRVGADRVGADRVRADRG